MDSLNYKHLIYEFVLSEVSRNDPIPELTRKKEKLAVFLVGPSASGKSTFFKNFIETKQKFINRYSTDELSKLRRKWDPEHQDKEPGEYIPGSSRFTIEFIKRHLKTGENFVWDTTGNRLRNVEDLVKLSKEAGYEVIFIYKLIPASTALDRLIKRNIQKTQPDTDIRWAMKKYAGEEMLQKGKLGTQKAQKAMKKMAALNADEFYIVLDVKWEDDSKTESKRYFFKLKNGKLMARKNFKYVPVN